MKTVALVDYGIGNVDSVRRALQECGADEVLLTSDRKEFEKASAIVLPGVGAFADGMKHLRDRGLVELLDEQVLRKRIPFLGICLGMQLLAKRGFEDGETPGLGWIDADCAPLKPKPGERIPHIGWNSVEARHDSPLLQGVGGRDFYFVHSYALQGEGDFAVGATDYAGGFIAAVSKDNVHGVQFHPEKSQKAGFAVLRNFLAL